MSVRRPADPSAEARLPASGMPPASARPTSAQPATAPRPPAPNPTIQTRSLEEAEARYVTVRDAWTHAMRKANSGRPADLASLALAQEAYEEAVADVARWRSGVTVAIPIQPEVRRAGLDALIGQEMAWRRVHEVKEKQPGMIARLIRRLTGRG